MSSLPPLLIRVYDKYLLEWPRLLLIGLLIGILFLAYQSKYFKLDASPQTLILETDQDLKYSQLIQTRYGGHEYLLITYTPMGDLFTDHELKRLSRLRDDLKNLENVASVASILDAPLLESPPLPVRELGTRVRTLESPDADRALARREFAEETAYHCRDLHFLVSFQDEVEGYCYQLNIFWTLYDGQQSIECLEGQELKFVNREQASDYLKIDYLIKYWDVALEQMKTLIEP